MSDRNPFMVLRERLVAEHSIQFGDRDDNYGKGAGAAFRLALRLIDELLPPPPHPCPFCGQEAGTNEYDEAMLVVTGDNTVAFVACHGCHTDGPKKATEEEAVAAWNSRMGRST